MLFQFDTTLAGIDANSHMQIRALENLLGAFQSGNHFLFCRMKELRQIIEKVTGHVSSPSLAMLQTMLNRSVEDWDFVNKLDYKVVVFIDEHRPLIYREKNSWYVSLTHLAQSGLLQSAILGENELDAELFLIFADLYRRKHGIKAFGVKARVKGGGGSGLPKAIESYLDSEASPCLSISDSDKFHPQGELSSTVKKCKNIIRDRTGVVEYMYLEEREVENLIPKDVLRKVVDLDRFLDACDNLLIDYPGLWAYVDLKNGPNLKWVNGRDAPTQEFWATAKTRLEKKRQCCPFCDSKSSDIDDTCSCSIIKGFGPGLLEKCIAYLKDNSPRLTLQLLATDTRWERIGKVAFNFAVIPFGERAA